MQELVSTHNYAIVDRFTDEFICWLCTNGGFGWLADDDGVIPDTLLGFVSTRDKATRAAIVDKVGTDCIRIVSR